MTTAEVSQYDLTDLRIPSHVAIIMDGNGRWAKARGLPRTEGHRQGTENLRHILRSCREFGIDTLTIYAFSTENWGRPQREVQMLMRILEMVIDREIDELDREGVRICHLGEMEGIAPQIQRKLAQAIERTASNEKLTVNVAFNYGGRHEIVHAVRHIIADGYTADEVDEDLINAYLYTHGQPDPDLVIRTSGELRVSNFLIWQGAYSEYYSTPTLWPDFDKDELYKAIVSYSGRKRRFGKTDEQIEEENNP